VCSDAGIYGHDGSVWAASKGMKLDSYNFDQPQEDGSTKNIPCNEHACAMSAVDGDRTGG